MTEREKIAARIRALRAKTVENGCTESEAVAAAEMLAALLAKYNMTLDEAEMRESPFSRHTETHDDWVGERLWKIAAAISKLTGARYWTGRAGEPPSISFFGFDHEVEVARYMLEICAGAMRREQKRILVGDWRLITTGKQRRAVTPFLDGMADRLALRIRRMKPDPLSGRGLVVLHDALVTQAMKDAGINLGEGRARGSRDSDAAYLDGRLAADRVALNPGLNSSGWSTPGLLR